MCHCLLISSTSDCPTVLLSICQWPYCQLIFIMRWVICLVQEIRPHMEWPISLIIFLGLQVSHASIGFTLSSPTSALIDKAGSQVEEPLCFPSIILYFYSPSFSHKGWALHLLLFQTEEKSLFCWSWHFLHVSAQLISSLPYTIPNMCLQIEWMYLRYEKSNEFDQP